MAASQHSAKTTIDYTRMKKPISATIDTEVLDWLDDMLKDKKRFRNKSHIIETALELLKEKEEEEETSSKQQKE
ncbi:hypothetical protein ACFL0W_03000 [Nanoarchaeota archaeon]